MILHAADQHLLLSLARATLQHFLQTGAAPTLADLGISPSPALRSQGAAFVTLTNPDGTLRGCIGDVIATVPLVESVMENAIRAATKDPRFPPVSADELRGLHIEISVLTPPRPVASPREIELGRHGIILTKHRHRALFLPQVATEQGWNLTETLSHLAHKAGLPADAWHTDTQLQIFEALVFEEHPS